MLYVINIILCYVYYIMCIFYFSILTNESKILLRLRIEMVVKTLLKRALSAVCTSNSLQTIFFINFFICKSKVSSFSSMLLVGISCQKIINNNLMKQF